MALAVVTGASSGIGRAIALALQARGDQVIAIGRNREALQALEAKGIQTRALDLSTPGLAAALADLAPDILINNAGIIPSVGPFCDAVLDDIARTIATNLTATLAVTRALAPGMRDRGRGDIVFVTSTGAHTAFANFATYCATKAALAQFAQVLRLELAPHGVRVTDIAPGRVETALYRDALDDADRAALYAGGGALQPQDVADAVLAALTLPPRATLNRIDIQPTYLPVKKG